MFIINELNTLNKDIERRYGMRFVIDSVDETGKLKATEIEAVEVQLSLGKVSS